MNRWTSRVWRKISKSWCLPFTVWRKNEGILRYNDVRPLITAIDGVEDFDTFLINGKMSNIKLEKEEYPVTGTIDFRS